MSLEGKIAVVTGGSRGIGRAVCLDLARQGAAVVFSYAGNTTAAGETEAACAALGRPARGVRADVTDAAAVKALLGGVVKEFGRIDILVNNAGVTQDGLLAMMKEESFDRVLDVDLKGAFNCIRHCAGLFLRQKAGAIVNVSSVSGLMGNAGQANYSAAKAGLIGLTKALAKEEGPSGITVNCVAPGVIETDMMAAFTAEDKAALAEETPVGRLGTADEVAKLLVFLAGEDAGYITGQVFGVNGGLVI